MSVFRYLFRVRYGECDAQNVVFNARYADYADLAATEFLRAIGMDYRDVLARGLDNQVVKLTLEWQAPARFDDVLSAEVCCDQVGNSSYRLAITFRRWPELTPVSRAEAVYVMVTIDNWQKTPVPDDIRAALLEGAAGKLANHAGVTV
ncbi:MAG: thioesterase family protein [Alcanivoracaceae bacterium]|nr:thioesterase family protein [Alcanivoracaceae bacterium]